MSQFRDRYIPGAGTRPDKSYNGGYGYAGSVRHEIADAPEFGFTSGYEAGFGIQSGQLGTDSGWHASSNLLSGEGFVGGSSDGKIGIGGGGARVAHFDVGYGSAEDNVPGTYGSFSADALGASADAWINPDEGAAIGAGAYLAQADLKVGNIGTGARDEESRIGVGEGVGAAGRLHWADKDGDGRREYGFGADIGPVSFDVKSEDPLMALAKMNPMTGMVANVADAFLPEDFNLTESAGNAASAVWSAVTSW